MKNAIRLDFSDNPALRDLFSGRKAGDKAKVVIRFQLNSQDETGIEGTIEALASGDEVDLDDDADGDPESSTVTPDADEPVAVLINSNAATQKRSET